MTILGVENSASGPLGLPLEPGRPFQRYLTWQGVRNYTNTPHGKQMGSEHGQRGWLWCCHRT